MRKRKFIRAIIFSVLSLLAFDKEFTQTPVVRAQPIDPLNPTAHSIDQSSKLNFIHVRYTPQAYARFRTRGPNDNTSPVVYHNGPVIQSLVAYTIFWDPNNTMSSTYQNLINRYFVDVGHSNFYNIATQYYQTAPSMFISSNSSFGGTYHDTLHAYPGGKGTAANPLIDSDIQNEVTTAIAANGWPNGGYGIEFFVFTAKGIESCADSATCTPGTAHPMLCAYHGSFGSIANPILYSNMPYAATWDNNFTGGSCGSYVYNNAPNDHDADEEIGMASHEHFETITDPVFYTDTSGFHGGWYDSGGWEIGDKCAYYYGSQAANGSNVTLNGNPYLVQMEWSNVDTNGVYRGGCSVDYGVNTRIALSGPQSTNVGRNITYTISITNAGPKPANGVVVSDTVPAHTTFVSLTQNSGPTSACTLPAVDGTGTIDCNLDTLANGASAQWALVLKVNAYASSAMTIQNIATVSQSATDSNAADNSSNVNVGMASPTAVTLSLLTARSETQSSGEITSSEFGALAGIILATLFGSTGYLRKHRR